MNIAAGEGAKKGCTEEGCFSQKPDSLDIITGE